MDSGKLYSSSKYMEDVKAIASLPLPWDKLSGKTVLITGATGMMGSCLIDAIMEKNEKDSLDCRVVAVGRNIEKARNRFTNWKVCDYNPVSIKSDMGDITGKTDSLNSREIAFIQHDINMPLSGDMLGTPDYILHLASNTHPVAYATDPIGTITSNMLGIYYLLEYASLHSTERVLFASSNEIYGENRGDTEFFKEDYCGYIDSNTLRAGYPESKRCSEALCQAYIRQKEMDVVIARPTRSYGPTMLESDTKAISQFIKKGVAGEDIVLKSEGNQFYSYTYVTDAVSGILTVLLLGERGEAYNIADEASDITLKDLANLIAGFAGKQVIFDLPDAVESAGYSKATKARLDGSKLKALGWKPHYDIKTGMERTIEIFRG